MGEEGGEKSESPVITDRQTRPFITKQRQPPLPITQGPGSARACRETRASIHAGDETGRRGLGKEKGHGRVSSPFQPQGTASN